MICKIYETLDKNPVLRKKLGYNQKSLDYFFIDNIIKKSKRFKKDIPKNNDNKKSSKKIINNMDYSKYIKVGFYGGTTETVSKGRCGVEGIQNIIQSITKTPK